MFSSVVSAQRTPPEFDVIRIGVPEGLSHRLVYDILEDKQGYIWVATREGLNRFDGHRFIVYSHIPGDSLSIPESKINKIFESSSGTLWIGSHGGLIRLNRKTETFYRVPFELGENGNEIVEAVMDIAETPDGTIWVATETSGIFKLDRSSPFLKRVPFTVDGKKGHLGSTKIGVGRDGRILLACSPVGVKVNHLGWLDPATAECSVERSLPQLSTVNAIGFYSDSSIIISAPVLGPTGKSRIRVERSKGHPLWSTEVNSLASMDMLEDGQGTIWVATLSGLVLLDSNGTVTAGLNRSEVDVKTLTNDRINALSLSRDGSVWVGTDDGITVFVPTRSPFRAIRHRPGDPNSLGDPRVNAILETSDGSVWIGTSKGLFKRTSGSEAFEAIYLPDFPEVISGAQSRIWSLIEVSPEIIWYGTAVGGLYQVDQATGKVQRIRELRSLVAAAIGENPLIPDRTAVPSLNKDRNGHIWIATARQILEYAFPDSFTLRVPTSTNGFPGRIFNVQMQDHRGDYWVGNDLGLWSFDPITAKLTLIGDSKLKGKSLSFRMVWAIAETPLTPDALWIGTVGGGLNRYDVKTGQFTWYSTKHGLPSNTVYGILTDSSGLLWLSTSKGLARLDPLSGIIEKYSRHDGLHDDDFDLFAYHKGKVSGKMWFGGPTGLTEFHPDSVAQRSNDFRVLISGINVLDQPFSGIVSSGDTLRLSRTENTLGFRFSAPDILNPKTIGYRFKLEGYDQDWREKGATRPEVTYTHLPPGTYTFLVQPSGTTSSASSEATRLVIVIEPVFWQTKWFQILSLMLSLFAFGFGVASIQKHRSNRTIEVSERKVELKRLLAEREEQERGRLAREIHDGPIQTLYSVNHRLEEASSDGLEASRLVVKELASELRAICSRLRPAIVDNLGLERALSSHIRKLGNSYPGVSISIEIDPNCSDLDEATAHATFRIVQEGVNNALHHSGASQVNIELVRDQKNGFLVISDNGKGFDLPTDWLKFARDSHYGLVGMRERAEMLGGTFRIASRPGEGTRIDVLLPWETTPSSD